MPNMHALRGTIIARGHSIEDVAENTGISRSTMYRKIADGGDSFSVKEIVAIKKYLNLNSQEFFAIFVDNYY